MKKYFIDKRRFSAGGICGTIEFYDENGFYLDSEYYKNNFDSENLIELKESWFAGAKGNPVEITSKLGNKEIYYMKGNSLNVELGENPFKDFKQERK